MARLSYSVMIIGIIGISLMCTFAQEQYDSKYDSIDIKAIFQDSKQRKDWYQCFIKTGPCLIPEAQYFAEILPEAYSTQCQKCNDKQKELLQTLTEWYIKNDSAKWQTLVANIEQQYKNKKNN